MERLLRCQRKAWAKEDKLLSAKGVLKTSYELASKDTAQDSDRQKESRRRRYPPLAVQRPPTTGHDTVNVWMPLQRLPPGVQNAQAADLGSEMLRVGRYFEQRLRACLEEEPEQDPLVLPHQRDQRMRHAENQMVVVPIAAGVVGDRLISAARALIPTSSINSTSAEGECPA